MRTGAVPVFLLSGLLPACGWANDTNLTNATAKTQPTCCIVTVEKEKKPEKKKYFIELFHLNGGTTKPSGGLPQAITLTAVCYDSAGANKTKLPCSNAVKNGEIDVTALSDSGLHVTLRSYFKGAAVALGAGNSYVPSDPGKLIIDASQPGTTGSALNFAPATPLRLEIYVSPELNRPPAVCAGLGQPTAWPLTGHLDASAVAKVLGNPEPFIVEPHGDDYLAIYAQRPVRRWEIDRLRESANRISRHAPADLGVQDSGQPFIVEMKIPHAVAFGDLAQKISTISFPDLRVENAGADNIRIIAAKQPSCENWTAFLSDLKRIIWSLSPEPFSTRLFFLDAAQVAPALSGAASFPSAASVAPIGADLVIFGDAHPGDDAAIEEKRRVIAALDVPRPEMIISAWVLQNSSTDSRFVGNFNDIVQRAVAENNDALQQGLFAAWTFLKNRMSDPAYFDPLFHRYVVGRFAANLPLGDDAIKNFLGNRSNLKFHYSNEASARNSALTAREKFGYCNANEYCLGYTDVFSMLQPRLTDLLIGVIASKDAAGIAKQAADALEHPSPPLTATETAQQITESSAMLRSDLKYMLDLKDTSAANCEAIDLRTLVNDTDAGKTSYVKLACFRQAIDKGLLASEHDGEISPVGLVRAALADFLFNYKMSQQYPHEFTPYNLTHSANDLNSALRPFVDAFDEDIVSYQRYLGARLQVEVNDFNKLHRSWVPWFKDKPFFVNNGIVTVRTISGQNATVDATSQSFLDASSAPQLSNLAQSILGLDQANSYLASPVTTVPTTTPTTPGVATPVQTPTIPGTTTVAPGNTITLPDGTTVTTTTTTPATTTTPTGIGRLIENISPNQAQLILGALSAYQSSKIQIGRDLSLSVSPRSLSGAASAEIQVTLNAAETAPPNYYTGPQAENAADLSRVAQHNTSTRVRVDSIKLFEISSFSAVLQRAHSRVPLLPPLVEIPYIGTIVGVPLPPASEYHSSTALLTALTIPTAADLTAGLTFRLDQVVDGDSSAACVWPGEPVKPGEAAISPCHLRRAISLRDLNDEPIAEFHRAMIHCLATEGTASGFTLSGAPVSQSCKNLTFEDVLH